MRRPGRHLSGVARGHPRAAAAPQPPTPRPPERASPQQSAGNLAIQRRCACGGGCASCAEEERALQAKDVLDRPGDAAEREADRVAGRVADAAGRPGSAAAAIAAAPAHEPVAAGSAAASAIDAVRMGGQPLDGTVRLEMELGFGRDFGDVRLHTGPAAAEAARGVNAHAYTVGNQIAFAAGRFAPGTSAGRHLLAHELTHVVQQSGPGGRGVQRDATDDLAADIARDLNDRATGPEPAALVLELFDKLSPDIQDNAGAAFIKLQPDAALDRFAATPLGRQMLDKMSEAMITGSVTLFESRQAERILVAERGWLATADYEARAERIAKLRHRAAPAFGEDAANDQRAEDLRVMVAGDHFSQVTAAFRDIRARVEDNIAGAIVEQLSDARLERIAGDPDGAAMLDVLYDAMITGDVSAFEALQSERILLARSRKGLPVVAYMTQAERIADLRNKAEDSVLDLAVDRKAREVARGLAVTVAMGRLAEAARRVKDLDAETEDNVASHLVELLTPARLDALAGDAEGRRLLDLCYVAIITGSVTDFERLQARRILDAKAARPSEADPAAMAKALGEQRLWILPLRMQKTFRSSYAIFKAKRQDDGRIKVYYDDEIHFWDADMFKADRAGLPYRLFRDGILLEPDQIVWLKLYDEGGRLLPVQAIELIDYANQAMRNSVSVGVSAFETGLFLGYGGLAAFSGEGVAATAMRVEAGEASVASLRLAKGVLWADRVSVALPIVSEIASENRDWILETFPNAGPVLLSALDEANRLAGYYGWARMGVDGARLLRSRLKAGLDAWRAEKAAASKLDPARRKAVSEIEANVAALDDELARTEADAAAEAVQQVEAHPELTSTAPPGERRAKVGQHEVVEVKEPGGEIHCEFHSEFDRVVCPAPWLKDQPKPAHPEGQPKPGEPGVPPGPAAEPPAHSTPTLAATPVAAPPNPRLAEIARELEDNAAKMQRLEAERQAAMERARKAGADAVPATGTERADLLAKAGRNQESAERLKREIEALRWSSNALRDEARRLAPPPPVPQTWQEAETALRREFNGQKQSLPTASATTPDLGTRDIDCFTPDRISREAKFGQQSLTDRLRDEIAKDMAHVRSGRVAAVEWHFYENPQSGMKGPSPRLREALEATGVIKIVIH